MKDKKILVVDDLKVNRDILRKYLENKYEIMEACDGEEAIELIEKHQLGISLILLDLVMPKKTGFDVLNYLTEYGYMSEIPIIIITSEAYYEVELKAFDYGVSDFVTKPFYPQIVQKRVQNLIDLYDTQKNLRTLLDEQTMELMMEIEEN